MVINQWVPAAHQGDAIGDSARRVRGLLRRMGHASDIYALTIDESLAGDVRRFGETGTRDGDITIFHYALPSPMTGAFASLPRGRVLQYHNITPAHFFAPWDAALFRLARLGREDLVTLAGRVDLALGDSEYNRLELDTLGFAPTGVFPIAVSWDRLTGAPPMPALEAVLGDGLLNILFVGRIAPNKKVEDLLRLGEHFKRYVNVDYRFLFAGRYDVVPRYYAALRAMIGRYEMPPERFLFLGPLTDAELAACYRTADVYVSLSEHEGFCVPLIEAMAADVPVLAYAAGAVPDTLGGAGVLFSPKDLEHAAELLGMLALDDGVRASIVAGQRRRLLDFGDAVIEDHLVALVDRAEQGW